LLSQGVILEAGELTTRQPAEQSNVPQHAGEHTARDFTSGLQRLQCQPRGWEQYFNPGLYLARGYAKFTGWLGVCLATSGPGSIHLLNGGTSGWTHAWRLWGLKVAWFCFNCLPTFLRIKLDYPHSFRC
jgi:hypothetical protein